MRKAKDQEEIKTIPHGCYECGAGQELKKDTTKERMRHLAMDLQGNGYPDYGRD